MTVRSGHPQRRGRSLFFMCVALIFVCTAGRLYLVSPFVASYDIANFTLAVGQYDLANLQPHFPGYPFFILLATGLARLGLEPVRALGIVSMLGFTSGLVPLYLLFKRRRFDTVRLLAAFTVVSTASLVVLSATGMSDGLALGVLCWFVWSVERARQGQFRLLPYLLFGLLMATRLSYAPFGIILLFLLWQSRRDAWQFVSETAVLLLAQLAWLLPVAFSVGGPASFAQLSLSFVTGHFGLGRDGTNGSSLAARTTWINNQTNDMAWSWICHLDWSRIGIVLVLPTFPFVPSLVECYRNRLFSLGLVCAKYRQAAACLTTRLTACDFTRPPSVGPLARSVFMYSIADRKYRFVSTSD